MSADQVFKRGDRVNKKSGYTFPGVIVSIFPTTAGLPRAVVEATGEEYRGMLHIFSLEQLTHTVVEPLVGEDDPGG